MYVEVSYLVYLVISLAVTVWVARTLYKNGAVFLVETFCGDTHLAESVNHFLVVGFCLISVGYVTQALATDRDVNDLRAAIELVSAKIGTILLVLGVMHFFNLYVFNRLRYRGQEYLHQPPIAPDMRISPREGKVS